MSLDEIKCRNNLVIIKGEKGISKISKAMSMVGQLNGFFLSHSSWPWCPTNFQFPEKKICNC